jgi:Na+-driven multidrug efflux pump
VVGIFYINKHYPFLRLTLLKFEVDKKLLLSAVKMGLPTGISQSLFSLGNFAMQGLVNGFGSIFMAGFTGANRLNTFAFIPIQSVDTAVTTFTGQNIGSGNLERVRKGLRAGLLMACGVGALVGLLALLFSGDFMSMFSDDERVILHGGYFLKAVLPFFAVQAVLYIFNAVLRGSGRTMAPMISMMVALLIIRVPVAYLLVAYAGPNSMFYAYIVGWVGGILIAIGYYFTGRWKQSNFLTSPAEV